MFGSGRGCRVGSKISTYMYNTCAYMQGTKWVNVDKLVALFEEVKKRDVTTVTNVHLREVPSSR